MTNRDQIRLRNAVFSAYLGEVGAASQSQGATAAIVRAVKLIETESLLTSHSLEEIAQVAVAAFVDGTLRKAKDANRPSEVLTTKLYTALFVLFATLFIPQDQDEDRAPERLKLLVKPGEASTEEILAILLAISDLHIAAGGLGLEFEVGGLYAPTVIGARS